MLMALDDLSYLLSLNNYVHFLEVEWFYTLKLYFKNPLSPQYHLELNTEFAEECRTYKLAAFLTSGIILYTQLY